MSLLPAALLNGIFGAGALAFLPSKLFSLLPCSSPSSPPPSSTATANPASASLPADVKELVGESPDIVHSSPPLFVPEVRALPKDAFVVLILGDGNFSFSLALARLLWPRHDDMFCPPATAGDLLGLDPAWAAEHVHIITTSFDPFDELVDKYPETRHILKKLETYPQVQVFHTINAWEVPRQFPNHRFNAILWNHPHLGLEDFRLHRFLMAHFFHSASSSLAVPEGFVSISLVDGQAERWDVTNQALRSNLAIIRHSPFDPSAFPGYETRRNRTGNSFQNTQTKKHTGSDMKSFLMQYSFNMGDRRKQQQQQQQQQQQALRSESPTDGAAASSAPTGASSAPSVVAPSASFSSVHVCVECKKVFSSLRGVTTHIRQVHEMRKYGDWKPNMAKTITCKDCGKAFHDEEAKWQHRISKHSFDREIKPQGPLTDAEEELGTHVHFVPCEVCGQAVPSSWHMEQHLETLKPLIGINALCKICNRSFTEHRALRQHLNFCRLKELPADQLQQQQLDK